MLSEEKEQFGEGERLDKLLDLLIFYFQNKLKLYKLNKFNLIKNKSIY